MITKEIRSAVEHSKMLKFYLDGHKPEAATSRVFPIEGADVMSLILAWYQSNPVMRNYNAVRLPREVQDEEQVLVECL